MNFLPRNGQWVKVALPAHRRPPEQACCAKDGLYVGIFLRAGRDATGLVQPERVVLVDQKGNNLTADVEGFPVTLCLGLSQVCALVPVTDRQDIPPQRLKGVHPSWQPRP